MIYFDNIEEAADNARRFLRCVNEAKAMGRSEFNGRPILDGGSAAAAIKRASMDLTRSLAKVRRNPLKEGA